MPSPTSDAEIFLSHATKNDAIVTRIHDELEDRTGHNIWVDHKDIAPGDHWQEEIEVHLKTCPKLLLAISRESVKSHEVTAEWRAALTYNHPMLLAIIDDLPVEDIPARLRLIQWVNLHTDWDGGIAALAAVITGNRDADSPLNAPDFKITYPITGEIERKLTTIPMTGRENELAEVKRRLKQKPVSILGVGGLGKSRLAVEVAMTHDDVHGAIWHRASATSTPEGVYLLLADHFRLDPATPRAHILSQLHTHPRLVILDNAEDVPPDDHRHADYLTLVEALIAHKAQVLLTSRLEWEAVQPGAVVTLNPLPLTEAAQVVVAMATAFDIKEDVIEKQIIPQAESIALAARQHPRLIEWAMRQMKRFEVKVILAELNALTSRETQKALDEMIGRTYRKMVDSGHDGRLAQIALSRLLPCRGGFTLNAATVLCSPHPKSFSLREKDLKTNDRDSSAFPPRHEGEGAGGEGNEGVLSPDDLRAALNTLMTWQFIAYDQTRQRYTLDPMVLTAADAGALTVDATADRTHFDYYYRLARTHHKKQDYLGLDPESGNLEAAFEWAMKIEDYRQAYWMSNATSFFLANRGRFGQRLDRIERVVAALGDHPDKRLWSAAQNSLGNVYSDHPLGRRRDNLSRAIAAYEAALVYATPEAAPLEYATTQNNLGETYRNLAAIEDRLGNLSRAITAFEAALVYSTAEAVPLDYAGMQNNLGAAYGNLSEIEDRAGNLSRAITAYRAALVYWTPEAAPLYYATTQNNLGTAYRDLAQIEDPAGNLSRAIAAYEAALVYRTPEAVPLGYAGTQNNLGNAYRDLAQIEDPAGNLSRAITAFKAALVYRTPENTPLDYAMTQYNLGIVYSDLSEIEDRPGNLSRAIAAYEAALVYRTPEAAPLDYATTQRNLGIVHEDLGDLSTAIVCWREAEKYYRQMDYVDEADKMLRWIADAEARMNAGASGGAGAADEGE